MPMFDAKHDFDYDLVIIGGGSGGLAAAKVRSIFSFSNVLSYRICSFEDCFVHSVNPLKQKDHLVLGCCLNCYLMD